MDDMNSKILYCLDSYYSQFPTRWEKQKYIWKSVQTFQNNWDLNASDLAKMIERSTVDADYLMNHTRYYPRDMIISLAEEYPDEVRSMFAELFDETQDLVRRAVNFSEKANEIRIGCKGKHCGTNHQTMNAVSTYLWLQYPEKYYFYKYTVAKRVSSAVSAAFAGQTETHVNKMLSAFSVMDQISAKLREDNRFRRLLEERQDSTLYPDPSMHCMAMDFAFYIRPCYENSKK